MFQLRMIFGLPPRARVLIEQSLQLAPANFALDNLGDKCTSAASSCDCVDVLDQLVRA